jgi:hypothetical protein
MKLGARASLRWTWTRVLLVFALFIALAAPPACAQSTEYQSKAARIARIAQVTSWPANKLGPTTPLVIGVFGDDTITNYLQEAVQGRRLKGRDVVVKRCNAVQEVVSCHVLFISRGEQDRLREILRKTGGEPILTIGETEAFMDKGGIVFLTMIGGSAQFTFDVSNLKRSHLEIDPETLALANPAPRK